MSDIKFTAGIDLGPLATGLSQAQSALRAASDRMAGSMRAVSDRFSVIQSSMSGFSSALTGAASAAGPLGAALAVAASAAGALVSTTRHLNDLNDAADVTGQSIEELSSLLNTLAPYGHGLDVISTASERLVKAMTQADDEAKGAGEAFRLLGVQTRDAHGNLRPTQDVLEDVAKALSEYDDGTNKTALAMAIFGRSGAALLPVLKDLAEAQRRGATLTTEQAEEAEKLDRSVRELMTRLTQMAQSVAATVIPQINRLIEQFILGREAAGGFVQALVRYGTATGTPAENVARTLERIAEANAKIKESEAGLAAEGPVYGARFSDRIEKERSKIAQYLKDLQYYRLLEEQAGTGANLRSPRLYDADGVRPPRPAPALGQGGGQSRPAERGPVGTFVDAETRALQELGRLFEQASATVGAEQADLLRRLDQMYFDGMIGAELYEGAIARLFRTSRTAGKDGVGELSQQLEQQAERWRDSLNPLRVYVRQLEEVRRLADEGRLTPQQRWMAENDLLPKLSPAPSPEEQAQTFNWLAATEAGFRRLFDAIKEGSVSAKSVMLGAFELIYAGVSDALAKMAGRWVVEMLIGKVASIRAALADISASAARAGAAAFASTAAIPYVGPALAPAAGAAAYSGAMSYAAGLTVASAEGGYDIPGWINPLTQLHAREMVLPAEHADTIRGLKGKSEEGPSVQHHHVWNVQAWDAPSVRDWLERNGEMFYPIAERAARNGAGPYRPR